MAWHGMAWYGMAWHGMVWYGMAWYDTARHGKRCGTPSEYCGVMARPSTPRCASLTRGYPCINPSDLFFT